MSACQVLALFESLAALEKILIDKKKKKLNLAAKFMVENNGRDHEEAMKFFGFNPDREMKYRSLVNGFLSDPHKCDMQIDETISIPNFVSLTDAVQVIKNSFKDEAL